MKISKKTILAGAIAAVLMQSGLWAAPPAKLVGPMQLKPQIFHREPITGTLTLSQNGSGVNGVKIDLDKPLMGRSSYSSSEQWSGTNGAGSSQQFVVAYKLQGPPHAWYFVFVGASADGGQTESGPIFRVDAKLSDIQAQAQNPLPAQPTGWKLVGSATLKAQ